MKKEKFGNYEFNEFMLQILQTAERKWKENEAKIEEKCEQNKEDPISLKRLDGGSAVVVTDDGAPQPAARFSAGRSHASCSLVPLRFANTNGRQCVRRVRIRATKLPPTRADAPALMLSVISFVRK